MRSIAVLVLVIAAAASACGCAAEQKLSDNSMPPVIPTPTGNDTTPTNPEPPAPAPPAAPVGPKYRVVEKRGGMELRKYKKGTWVTMPVAAHDFHFTTEISYEDLLAYFNGDNFAEEKLPLSTPLRLQFNMWDLTAQRYASFFVPVDKPPAPKYPLFLQEATEVYVYAVTFNETFDFPTIARDVADVLVDLVHGDDPINADCDGTDVLLDLYSFPKGAGVKPRPDEILITRVKSDENNKKKRSMVSSTFDDEALQLDQTTSFSSIVAS